MPAFSVVIEKTGGVQGRSDPNRELLNAGALVGHLVPEGTVYRFLGEHRQRRWKVAAGLALDDEGFHPRC